MRKIVRLYLTLFLTTLATSCTDAQRVEQTAANEQGIIEITGVVIDAETEQGLVGVPVYLLGSKAFAITVEGGQYTLKAVPAGAYKITAASAGYEPSSDSLQVSGDEFLSFDLALKPKKGEDEAVQAARNRTVPSKTIKGNKSQSDFETVCDCHSAAMTSLDEAIELRKSFDSMASLDKDQSAAKKLTSILDTWHEQQEVCLVNFGTRLLEESACNQPDEVSVKRAILAQLGISI